MWISAPTPVMSRMNTIDSGSISRPASTLKLPTTIQLNICRSISRCPSLSLRTEKNSIAA
jgi:hypothetical protein